MFALLPTITQYLVENWFRIVDDAERHREHGNQARARASELWARVCEAFAAWAEGEVVALVRKASGNPDDELLVRQIGGLVAALAKKMPDNFKRARQPLERVMERVEAICGRDLLEKIEQGRANLDAAGQARWLRIPVKPLVGKARPHYLTRPALNVAHEEVPY